MNIETLLLPSGMLIISKILEIPKCMSMDSKMKSKESLYYQYKKTSLKQNLIFDASPLDNHSENFSFRERNHSKEIQPELRFQPRTSIDRVK